VWFREDHIRRLQAAQAVRPAVQQQQQQPSSSSSSSAPPLDIAALAAAIGAGMAAAMPQRKKKPKVKPVGKEGVSPKKKDGDDEKGMETE
jgi:hypothetical protein